MCGALKVETTMVALKTMMTINTLGECKTK